MPEQQLVVDHHSGPAVLQLRQYGWLRREYLRLLLRSGEAPQSGRLFYVNGTFYGRGQGEEMCISGADIPENDRILAEKYKKKH